MFNPLIGHPWVSDTIQDSPINQQLLHTYRLYMSETIR